MAAPAGRGAAARLAVQAALKPHLLFKATMAAVACPLRTLVVAAAAPVL
jgi:hypothetical protein